MTIVVVIMVSCCSGRMVGPSLCLLQRLAGCSCGCCGGPFGCQHTGCPAHGCGFPYSYPLDYQGGLCGVVLVAVKVAVVAVVAVVTVNVVSVIAIIIAAFITAFSFPICGRDGRCGWCAMVSTITLCCHRICCLYSDIMILFYRCYLLFAIAAPAPITVVIATVE